MHPPDIHQLLKRTGARYIGAQHVPDGLSGALQAFGLFPEPTALQELSPAKAVDVLALLLWKDMAYGVERCDQAQAKGFAKQVVSHYNERGARFLSNGNWAQEKTWYPLTRATFDSGIVIELPDSHFACLWFEDED